MAALLSRVSQSIPGLSSPLGRRERVCACECVLGEATVLGRKEQEGGSRQNFFRPSLGSTSLSLRGSTVWTTWGCVKCVLWTLN